MILILESGAICTVIMCYIYIYVIYNDYDVIFILTMSVIEELSIVLCSNAF